MDFQCRRRSRKRLAVSQRLYERACNRIADVNVTFCKKKSEQAKLVPVWS